MPGPRLKAPKNNGSPPPEAQPIPLPALNISGVVVKKKDLVAVLKVFVPLLADIQPFEDGENFYLVFDGQHAREETGEID